MTNLPEADDLNVLAEGIKTILKDLLNSRRSPSPWELIHEIEQKVGYKARAIIKDVITQSSQDPLLQRYFREYLQSLLAEDEKGVSPLHLALAGGTPPRKEVQSGIDSLIQQSKAYRESAAFQEMISFMAHFRDYAPFNNMLVRIQNPTCAFYATERDWRARFDRKLKEDPRPMLILAPMHPVMLVYDLDQTEGPPLPTELDEFASFSGQWKDNFLERTLENAVVRDRIRIDFKPLSSTNAGFATIAGADGSFKMRIAIHEKLDAASRYGVLCHELAHIYLGHLGSDGDYWWPSRINLDHNTVEIEAESVAYLVTSRLGLQGASAPYISRHMRGGKIPDSVSLDLIAKTASRIEEMATRKHTARETRQRGAKA